ncbi:4-phosphoerythronate dehydrogenase [Candidatus Tachikawaea gelatinosa]|uniref:Erythronate-4-phosphate dehydrogenase n=1 Tax=Candidatus Tachikawaea gelatinosa TaxID=1410383 RepID=A0A090AJ37_9ENTR|nr:4-phosphoerythronate dehydrogenase [Candidatus Tachikawaea gelatinosa]BAP58448.1 erythronate-4-phosphate dehydrogenase [Candidatus Tachikawaea gelatinosa]
MKQNYVQYINQEKKVKIVIDENIPYANELFSRTGDVINFSGRHIPKEILHNAHGLIVRSITKVDKNLLSNTTIKFVGTVTAGTDHIDKKWLDKSDIKFCSAPGCNSISVVEYVFAALLKIAQKENFLLKNRTIGIIGFGNIGSLLHRYLNCLGIKNVLCDPPLSKIKNKKKFFTLKEIIKQADILTLHVPLYNYGPYKSLHLFDKSLLSSLKKNTIIINTCRGSVINNLDLLEILDFRSDLKVVLDVWENEPNFLKKLLKKIDIGTAHIAGHTLEGKVRATIQVYKVWCEFIKKSENISIKDMLPTPIFTKIYLNGSFTQSKFRNLVHLIYDINQDDISLRNITTNISENFDKIRKNYGIRREWSSIEVCCNDLLTEKILRNIGFSTKILYKNNYHMY